MFDRDKVCLTLLSWSGLSRKVISELFSDGSDQKSTPEKQMLVKMFIIHSDYFVSPQSKLDLW